MGITTDRLRSGRAARLAACLGLFGALALAGCGGTTHRVPVATADAAPATAVTRAAPSVVEAESATEAPDSTELAALPEDAEEPAPPSYEKAEPADPARVMGLARGEIETLLGRPGLVRQEAPAEVWQYQSRGCVLDLFMYEASADYEVVYIEARDGKALAAAAAVCLGAVMDDRRRTPTS
ncbi:MAG: hypothetical protein BroJett029_40500 [Alphaproteobacteria bacterium]|nr:MAG: hypothetical protein BroJett029_40500 [Alphaproteobacteria bacterium]